jgi:hypothetical protein
LIVSIEREHNTPTPGKSPRYRVRIRATQNGPAILISASNFGSVTGARNAMDDFLGPLDWRSEWPDGVPLDQDTRFVATWEPRAEPNAAQA